jgi:hypothetical protein
VAQTPFQRVFAIALIETAGRGSIVTRDPMRIIHAAVPRSTWLLVASVLALPAVAHAKPTTTEEVVAAAKASPLYKKSHTRAQLKKAKLVKVAVATGVDMDLRRYVQETALDKRSDLAPLFDAKAMSGLVVGTPTYQEKIHELSDRFVIERRLTVPLAPGACDGAKLPKAVDDLCFRKNPKAKATPSKAVAKDLASIRAKLAKAPDEQIVKGTVKAIEARAMKDEQLLALLLNTDARTIHHVSIVPRHTVAPGTKGAATLGNLAVELPTVATDAGLATTPKGTGPKGGALTDVFATPETFARKYFLTGFTYGREIEDSWEYTFANATWLTDRYYVHVDYHLGLGFGVRAPFSIDVRTDPAGSGARKVEMSVDPVNVDENGSPAYSAVGLPASKTFDGKEFVLEFKASCGLYVSIPGPDIDKKCPTIDKGWSRDIDPVIGTDSSQISEWWLDGKVTGLGIDATVAAVTLDLGLGADATNGRIGMRVSPLTGSSVSGIDNGRVSFSSVDPLVFQVSRTGSAANAGMRLHDPRYGFDIRLTPKLRAKVKVDVAIYENQWILGPYPLDFLSVAHSFSLTHHTGTVAEHDYELFHSNEPQVFDPGTSGGTTPPVGGTKPPKSPVKPATAGKLPGAAGATMKAP